MTNTASNRDLHAPAKGTQQPAAPAVDADVLMSRWRAATDPLGVFWPRQPRWHRDAATSAPEGAGSSNRLQGLHPC